MTPDYANQRSPKTILSRSKGMTDSIVFSGLLPNLSGDDTLAACLHSIAGCLGGVLPMTYSLWTIGGLFEGNLVLLGEMACIPLGMALLSYPKIWPHLLLTQNPDPELKPGSRVAHRVLHTSLHFQNSYLL